MACLFDVRLIEWNISCWIGALALGLWWHVYGPACVRRLRARWFGTCVGCGRDHDNCSCSGVTFEPDDDLFD